MDDQVAVTPAGNPTDLPIPDTPAVVCVIFVRAVWIHKVGVEEAALMPLVEDTVIVPVALTLKQPPVNGME